MNFVTLGAAGELLWGIASSEQKAYIKLRRILWINGFRNHKEDNPSFLWTGFIATAEQSSKSRQSSEGMFACQARSLRGDGDGKQ